LLEHELQEVLSPECQRAGHPRLLTLIHDFSNARDVVVVPVRDQDETHIGCGV
jgi:hypothetical protein